MRSQTLRAISLASLPAWIALPLLSQLPENPLEPNGTSIPYRYVHLVHSADPSLQGATAYLRARDPFLFFQIGRELVHRHYLAKDGAVPHPGEMNVPLYVARAIQPAAHGSDVRFARDHANSCDFCHGTPSREPGAGQNVASTSAFGRNAPHFYGAGLMEMAGAQIRQEILNTYDRNRNGLIDRDEVRLSRPVRIAPEPGAPPIDYGDLSPGADGVPRLNSLFRLWYFDSDRRLLPEATGFNDKRVAAFDFAVQVFGWGRGWHTNADGTRTSEGGEATTIREIFTLAANVHMGLRSYDTTEQGTSPGGVAGLGGAGRISLNGAQQFDFGTAALRPRTVNGYSDILPAPGELTEGDIDAAEFYMLNAPQPAVRSTPASEAGRQVLLRVGCARCHVENWTLPGRNERLGFAGDRRMFRLLVHTETGLDGSPQLIASLDRLFTTLDSGDTVPAAKATRIERIYTDFKHWDIGPKFFERRYDGSLQRDHRTAPLWGVGTTAPYGHSGQFATLQEAIEAHAGAAEPEARAFRRLSEPERLQLISYLESLVLYPTDGIPADIDGDGQIADNFEIDGVNVGFERFDPRFLFAVTPRFHRLWWSSDPEGRRFPLMLLENVADTYRLNLLCRRDANGNGIPDVLESPAVAALK
ncbi:MAG TPA: di-heme oxidoredictase family protein [Bryobacteraceae bacterium]|jgi:hypothetical protein|nr:di-heme oxidoredictase family protein [Bryobacteraceae bacterium]